VSLPLISDVLAQLETIVRINRLGEYTVPPLERPIWISFSPHCGAVTFEMKVFSPAAPFLDVRVEIVGLRLHEGQQCLYVTKAGNQMFPAFGVKNHVINKPAIRMPLFHVFLPFLLPNRPFRGKVSQKK